MDFFLLDTNLFREATKTPGNRLLRTLIPELRTKLGLEFGAVGTAMRVSPFSLLEALGIVPTMPAKLEADFEKHSPKEIFKRIFDDALAFFRNQPELQASHLLHKHEEQLRYINVEARPMFDVCVSSVLQREIDMTEVLASFLATDYLFKYPFKRQEFEAMGELLAASFFTDFPENAPASRFRVSMRMLDFLREKLRSQPGFAAEAAALQIKSAKDFLDTDIIQEITFGYPYENTRHRVVVLTFDQARDLEARAIWHRQAGIAFASKFSAESAMSEIARPYFTHVGGVIVQSEPNGTILEAIDLRHPFSLLDHPYSPL